MAETLEFRTKRLTGFMPEDEQRPVGEASNRAFWIGPEQTNTKPFEDTSPCEMGQDSGDCV